MGISKAMMEKLVIAKARISSNSKTILCATRYGNVMASRGSVIPLFVDLIRANEDLTVTDPNMTRFLMSLEDSVDLVLYAFKNANQGDIFVQQAPASSIEDLAIALSSLFNSQSKISTIGTRHGEKLYESLLSREEMSKAEEIEEYYRIPMDSRDLNYNKYYVEGEINVSDFDSYTSHNTQRLNVDEIKHLLLKLDYIKEALNA